jgi:hypothetical protein
MHLSSPPYMLHALPLGLFYTIKRGGSTSVWTWMMVVRHRLHMYKVTVAVWCTAV